MPETMAALNRGEFELVEMSRENAAQILALINEIQPHIPWSTDYLGWQFFSNPVGAAKIYAIVHGPRIVSLYAAVAQRIRVGDEIVSAQLVQDVMTLPAYRNRGLLHWLGARCAEDLDRAGVIGLTFPNKLSENSFRRNGWTELCRVPLREVNVERSAPDARRGLTEGNDILEEIDESYDGRVAHVWQDSGNVIGIERDTDYLNWRYSKPGQEYRRFVIDGGRGFLVVKPYVDGNRSVLHICDLVVCGSARKLITPVLAACRSLARAVGADGISAWVDPRHPYASDYDGIDLRIVTKHDRTVFVRTPKRLARLVTDPGVWHLSQGDSDVY